jgi:uncharacterized protein (TIGR03435 family)
MSIVFSFVCCAASLGGQTAPDAFEVASVKSDKSGSLNSSMMPRGDRFVATNVTVETLLLFALDTSQYQLFNVPDWARQEHFDIVAKAESPLTTTQIRDRLRSLLGERFHLAYHSEQRELPIYALVTARKDRRLGPALRHSGCPDSSGLPTTAGALKCGATSSVPGRLYGRGIALEGLAGVLSVDDGRQVHDRTGLSGLYDFELEFEPQGSGASGGTQLALSGKPSIYAALPEQLGLELEPRRELLDVTVVDRLEHPTED